jgi:hypothetical protein
MECKRGFAKKISSTGVRKCRVKIHSSYTFDDALAFSMFPVIISFRHEIFEISLYIDIYYNIPQNISISMQD